MKKILFLAAAIMTASAASAQTKVSSYSLRAGFNSSTYRIGVKDASLTANLGNKAGFYLGGQAIITIDGVWSFQPELVYSLDGTRQSAKGDALKALDMGETDNLSGASSMHNINVPLLLRMQASDRLSLMAGPYVSYRLAYGFGYNDNVKSLVESSFMED